MKKLLLLGVIALAVVACERQQENNAAKPAAVTEKPAVKQTIIDNKTTETTIKTPEKTPEVPPVEKTPVVPAENK
jgi:uncharacterized protein YcfL